MTQKAQWKRKLILEGAASVFIRKGYNATTMQDIVAECGISRGGLYLYFDSTETIFYTLLMENSQSMELDFMHMMAESQSFREIMECFFDKQRAELIHAEQSMMTATYEFFLTHKSEQDKRFLQEQYDRSVTSLLRVLEYGVARNEVRFHDPEQIVRHIILSIEGIRIYTVSVGVSHSMIEGQIEMLKSLVMGFELRFGMQEDSEC
ncbi:putative HTH-type transcriptional regulator YfiR [compost metagenome]